MRRSDIYQVDSVNKAAKNAKYKNAARILKHGIDMRLLMPNELNEWRRSLSKISNGDYHPKLKGGL